LSFDLVNSFKKNLIRYVGMRRLLGDVTGVLVLSRVCVFFWREGDANISFKKIWIKFF